MLAKRRRPSQDRELTRHAHDKPRLACADRICAFRPGRQTLPLRLTGPGRFRRTRAWSPAPAGRAAQQPVHAVRLELEAARRPADSRLAAVVAVERRAQGANAQVPFGIDRPPGARPGQRPADPAILAEQKVSVPKRVKASGRRAAGAAGAGRPRRAARARRRAGSPRPAGCRTRRPDRNGGRAAPRPARRPSACSS